MNKILLVFAVILLAVPGKAQNTADIGIWGGTSGYIGDIDDAGFFQQFNPNFGAYYRYNFNARVSLRAQLLMGGVAADGMIEGVETSFSKSVEDLSLQIEINYLKYIIGLKNMPFSPYVMAGVGVAYFPYEMDPALISTFNTQHNKGTSVINESVISATIPFGFGFKYTIGQRLGIGVEYQMRKLFSDKLDNLDDPLAYEILDSATGAVFSETKYTDALHNNDWTGYFGLHVTYKIYVGKKACPAYESKN
ncbi:MAG: DUF6089 family protein [Draconibacterium sp.]